MANNIIITGANQGIGYYMVEKLLAEGNKVSVLDIETNNLTNNYRYSKSHYSNDNAYYDEIYYHIATKFHICRSVWIIKSCHFVYKITTNLCINNFCFSVDFLCSST